MRYDRRFLVPYLCDVASVELIKAWCEQEVKTEKQMYDNSCKKMESKQRELELDVPPKKIPEFRSELNKDEVNKPRICLIIAVIGSIAWWMLRKKLHWIILAVLAIVILSFYFKIPELIENAEAEYAKENRRRAEYGKRKEEYEKQLKAYKKRKPQREKLVKEIEAEKKKQSVLLQRQAFYKARIQDAEKKLAQIYSVNVIPSPYRNRHAAFYLYDYFSTSQEDDLDGIIKTFVLEKVAAKLDSMITLQTQHIINQQKMLEGQIIQREQSLENHRENMRALAKMEKNAEQRGKYLKMINANAELSNYLHQNQEWIVEIK